VIEVVYLVVKGLESPFRKGNQANGEIEAGEPGGSLDEVSQMFQVISDISACANASHGRDESDGSIGLNHTLLLNIVSSAISTHLLGKRRKLGTPPLASTVSTSTIENGNEIRRSRQERGKANPSLVFAQGPLPFVVEQGSKFWR